MVNVLFHIEQPLIVKSSSIERNGAKQVLRAILSTSLFLYFLHLYGLSLSGCVAQSVVYPRERHVRASIVELPRFIKKPSLYGCTSLISLFRYCLLYFVKVRSPPHSGHGSRLVNCVCSFILFLHPLSLQKLSQLLWIFCKQFRVSTVSTRDSVE